jgi:hypothetical protein
LWLQVKVMVLQVQTAEGVLIFDDTIQEKAWTDESDLICWHYDHCSGRTVKGINLLNALYHCNGRSIPVAFELVQKPLQCDMASRQVKRKSEKTKNEMMREMIHACLQNALQFHFVLMDSWFSSQENFDFITSRGKHFIAALKDNRLVALSQEDCKKKRFVRVDELEFPEQGAVQGWLKGSARAVRLVRQVFKNQDSSTGRLHLVCSDLTCDYDAIPLDLQKTVASGGVSQILEALTAFHPVPVSKAQSMGSSSPLPRRRALCTNSKKPKYKGNFSWEIPRWGRNQERSSDQKPSIVLTCTS